ncbi:hypothetical protein AB1N83_005284 [Pleurotus pulmonarius]
MLVAALRKVLWKLGIPVDPSLYVGPPVFMNTISITCLVENALTTCQAGSPYLHMVECAWPYLVFVRLSRNKSSGLAVDFSGASMISRKLVFRMIYLRNPKVHNAFYFTGGWRGSLLTPSTLNGKQRPYCQMFQRAWMYSFHRQVRIQSHSNTEALGF